MKKPRPYYFKRLNSIGLPTGINEYYKTSRQEELYSETYKLLYKLIINDNITNNDHNVTINYSISEKLYNSVNAELFRESSMATNIKWATSPLLTVLIVTLTGFVLNKYINTLPLAGAVLIVLTVLAVGIFASKLFVAPDVNFRILYLQECLRMINEITGNTHVAVEIEKNDNLQKNNGGKP